ncbi:MAG: hypothetical protein ACTSRG_23695 [Candidatus Helarchaeota archaeon]
MDTNEIIPPHLKEMINIGEEIISIFRGNYKRKSKRTPKNMSNCIMVLTNERILVNSVSNPLELEKLFLSNVFSVDHSKGKNKIKISYTPRGSDKEDVISLEVQKSKGEKKEDFTDRLEKIINGIEGFFESPESQNESDTKNGAVEIPDMIIKPMNPMGLPIAKKDEKETRPVTQEKRFCHNCGEKLQPGGQFCAKCGTKQ